MVGGGGSSQRALSTPPQGLVPTPPPPSESPPCLLAKCLTRKVHGATCRCAKRTLRSVHCMSAMRRRQAECPHRGRSACGSQRAMAHLARVYIRCIVQSALSNSPAQLGHNLQGGGKFCTGIVSPWKVSCGGNFAALGIPVAPNCLAHALACKPMLRFRGRKICTSHGH